MALAPFLFMRFRSQNTSLECAVFQYTGTTVVQVGDTFDLVHGHTATSEMFPRNRVIQFKGEIYAVGTTGIWQKDDPTTITGGSAPGWTRVFTFTDPEVSANSDRFSGIYAVDIDGTPNLVGFYGDNTSATRWRGYMFNDNDGWTDAPAGEVITGSMSNIGYEIMHNGLIYFLGNVSNVTRDGFYNPVTGAIQVNGASIWGTTNYLSNALFIFKNKLYALFLDADEIKLAQFSAGTWGDTGLVITDKISTSRNKYAAFSQDDSAYLFVLSGTGGTDDGWKCFEMTEGTTEAFSFLDISTDVLPPELLSADDNGFFAGSRNSDAAAIVINVESDPENPSIFLYHTSGNDFDGEGNPWNIYQWMGNDTKMNFIGVAGDSFHAPPTQAPTGGERTWVAGDLDVSYEGRSAGPLGSGTILFDFIAYGDPGIANKIVRGYLNVDNNNRFVQLTLTSVTGGSAVIEEDSTGTKINGVDTDGVTVYQVAWDYEADGFEAGDGQGIKFRISADGA